MIDTTTPKLALARNLIALGADLANAWSAVQRYNQLFVKDGFTYSAGDFDNTTIAFVDPTQIPTLVTDLNAFASWMTTNGNGDLFFRMTNGQ